MSQINHLRYSSAASLKIPPSFRHFNLIFFIITQNVQVNSVGMTGSFHTSAVQRLCKMSLIRTELR